MKITIKTQALKYKVRIYIPMIFVKLAMVFAKSAVKGYIKKEAFNKENIKYIEAIDFDLLSQSLNILKEYKGLKMVDIHSSDGTEVEIWV